MWRLALAPRKNRSRGAHLVMASIVAMEMEIVICLMVISINKCVIS